MAPKKNAAAASGSTAAEVPSVAQVKSAKAAKASSSYPAQLCQLGDKIWSHYLKTTGHQTRLIDAFLIFLMAVGALQFVYFVLVAKDVCNTLSLLVLMAICSCETDTKPTTAFQRLPCRLRRHCWPVRPDRYVATQGTTPASANVPLG